ncbi:MAG TPA: hypothetical protein VFY43_08190 [Candidatus Limnocylindria bacterium]|nr:hypothetical protein [Candidatus Limnocylindria bacterium]
MTSDSEQMDKEAGRAVGAVGMIFFASVMMVMIGFFHAMYGLAAILQNDLIVAGPEYIWRLDVTTWGWIHLIAGILVLIAGWSLFSGATWARVVGITLALISAIANFASIPYYPFWSILIIILDVLVIWALAVYGGELAEGQR